MKPTKDLIAEARGLAEKATPGPWRNCGNEAILDAWADEHICRIEAQIFSNEKDDNASFIARSRTLVPELCDALESTLRQLANARNELCQRCGLYRDAHNGACDWCKWREAST